MFAVALNQLDCEQTKIKLFAELGEARWEKHAGKRKLGDTKLGAEGSKLGFSPDGACDSSSEPRAA
eukprot:2061087-Prymnesium_polylepis.1